MRDDCRDDECEMASAKREETEMGIDERWEREERGVGF